MANMMTKSGIENDKGANIVKKGMDIVKYGEPSLVMKTDVADIAVTNVDFDVFEPKKRSGTGFPVLPQLPGLIHPTLVRDTIFSKDQLDFVLDRMFPNIVWRQGNKILGKSVTTEQTSRVELRDFKDNISYKEACLGVDKQSHSKMKVQLHLRCLDELIRQDTLNCAERGLFLKEIRDYLAQQFKIYHRMMKQASRFDQKVIHRIEDDTTAKTLTEERSVIVTEIHELSKVLEEKEIVYNSLDREYKCQEAALNRVRDDEIVAIRKCNLNLLSMLQAVNPDCQQLPEILEVIKQSRKACATGI